MNDEEMLTVLRRSLSNAAEEQAGAYLAQTPETIMDRARRRMRHRTAAGASMGAMVLAVGLGTAFGVGFPRAAVPQAAVHVTQPGWSVRTGAHGVIYLTIQELTHPDQLRKVLAQAGVPARIVLGKMCEPKAGGGLPGKGVVSFARHGNEMDFAINTAKMPRGSELLIDVVGYSAPGHHSRASFSAIGVRLIRKGAALTCHKLTPPKPIATPSSVPPTAIPTMSATGPAGAALPVAVPTGPAGAAAPVPMPTS